MKFSAARFFTLIFYILSVVSPVSAELFPRTYDVDTGFRPNSNGFSFENYGNYACSDTYCNRTFPVENLTSNEMRRMFGDKICKKIFPDGSCELLKVAESWMDEVNEAMDGGHCEGMAVLSALFFAGIKDPLTFGKPSVNSLRLEGNIPLQNEIAYWYATQWYMDDYLIEEDPNTQLQILIEEFQNHPNVLIPVGIYKRDFSGGHAITAYAVQEKEDGIFWIMVYDNNYPGEERHIIVDTKNNSWEYSGASMTDLAEELYDGEWHINPFQLAPINSRLGEFECDFCPAVSSSLPAVEGEGGSEPDSSPLPELLFPESSPTETESTPETAGPWDSPAAAFNKIGVDSEINIYIESEDGLKSGYDWEDAVTYKEIPNVEIKRSLQRTTAKLPTDLVYYLWLNSPENEDWTTFDVDITSPGTILYLTDVLESYEYPNLIYTPPVYDADTDVHYEQFEVVASPGYLPGVEFVISDEYGEYSFAFVTEFTGDTDLEANIDFLIYHDYDSGQLGIEIYAADEEELAQFEDATFRIYGDFSIDNEIGEQVISTPPDNPIELSITGPFTLIIWHGKMIMNISLTPIWTEITNWKRQSN